MLQLFPFHAIKLTERIEEVQTFLYSAREPFEIIHILIVVGKLLVKALCVAIAIADISMSWVCLNFTLSNSEWGWCTLDKCSAYVKAKILNCCSTWMNNSKVSYYCISRTSNNIFLRQRAKIHGQATAPISAVRNQSRYIDKTNDKPIMSVWTYGKTRPIKAHNLILWQCIRKLHSPQPSCGLNCLG